MSKLKMFTSETAPLSPAVFYILLALAVKERHGYDIMKQVSADSKRKVILGPGTLYGSIKKMVEEKLIVELGERPDPTLDDERRRYYQLTTLGKKMLSTELKRFEEAIETAKNINIDLSTELRLVYS